jgi:peptide methionine sulfoxide reductase msrA/msrB
MHQRSHSTLFSWLAIAILAGALAVFYFTKPMESAMAAEKNLPTNVETIVVGMGCFWGAEKRMAALNGVLETEVGYAGGNFADATYKKVLAAEHVPGVRNHAEVVKVVFDPAQTTLEHILAGFWENHDPTQGDRQGNDIGTNYRSAIYYNTDAQRSVAEASKTKFQEALTTAGHGAITTEIAPLAAFWSAEEYHQDYLVKNPRGYCGLGGTNVRYPGLAGGTTPTTLDLAPLNAEDLNTQQQLIVFEAEDCPYCVQFKNEVLSNWKSPIAIVRTRQNTPPGDWSLSQNLWATPTIVLFEQGKEVDRYTGYDGDSKRFWGWLGYHLLSDEERKIAFEQGTERPFTGSLLDNKKPGNYVDPITGVPLFRSDTKFNSGTGWPSFFEPYEGALTTHEDSSHGMTRVEVRSASSGIHLGHVFNDGPPPTGQRYCINSRVLRFVPDEE